MRKLDGVSSHDEGRRAAPAEIDASANHWDLVYGGRGATGVSWYQAHPTTSIRMIEALGPSPDDPVIDVGGGASHLAGHLLARGFRDLTVLDLSPAAMREARGALGGDAHRVHWIEHDLLTWRADRRYGVWHDRAVFHFLTRPEDQSAYVEHLARALRTGGHAIIATFALDGPAKCSGLDVARYSPATLADTLGERFELLRSLERTHVTPAAREQRFTYTLFRKRA